MPDLEPLVRRLEWDSSFFGMGIARYTLPGMDGGQAQEVEAVCRREGIDCMYFLVDPHDVASLESARTLMMRLAGIRIVFHLESLERYAGFRSGEVRPARAQDMPGLMALAARLHPTTRFFLDPGFDRAKAGELYSRWIERSFEEPGCMLLTAGEPGAPTGYCLSKYAENTSTLEMLGVDHGCQGTGLGRTLMSAGLGWLASKGACDARLVTQGGGPGLLRFYEKAGFVIESVGLWFHYWPGIGSRA
jgi:ribosomal protein S18 acetylase RimI-like enzyme